MAYPVEFALHFVSWKNFRCYSDEIQEEECCLLFSNISFRSRDIQVFKICKVA